MSTFKVGDTVLYEGEEWTVSRSYITKTTKRQKYHVSKVEVVERTRTYVSAEEMTLMPQSPTRADNPHYARAARLESEMDACSASGEHEEAAVKRGLMQAALWDWYQATKRGEK